MKINLGCGEFYAEGWVNIDLHAPSRKDIVADIRKPLPVEQGVTHAYLGHVLEHLTLDEAALVLMNVWERMTPDGQIMIVGPDVDRGQAMLDRGDIDQEQFGALKISEGPWPGAGHLWDCIPATIVELLKLPGTWTDVREIPITAVPSEWPVVSRIGWQCAVSAVVSREREADYAL